MYLFKVLAEETRTPEGRQLEEIKSDGVLQLVHREEGRGRHRREIATISGPAG